ncbi:hypothetical protein P3X46_011743 [Hevea brasiliensis]|uniref:Uncharacterized protein n=1 Tax=Hevea brasiliensis TaxID=3981 RepID=A0ABQ9M980_HEVBR|nr:hypothetical protein P3X46_011743 [Hevea brasiliensis]
MEAGTSNWLASGRPNDYCTCLHCVLDATGTGGNVDAYSSIIRESIVCPVANLFYRSHLVHLFDLNIFFTSSSLHVNSCPSLFVRCDAQQSLRYSLIEIAN